MKVFAWWPRRAALEDPWTAPAALAACPGPRPRLRAAWWAALAFLMANHTQYCFTGKKQAREALTNGFKIFSPLGLSLRL